MSSLAQFVLGFVQFTILARLLDPTVFGVYAQVTATVVLLSTIPSFGMNSAFLHRSQHTENLDEALSSFFTI